MPKNFNLWPPNNPGNIIRLALVVLVAANLVCAWFVFRPAGGSPQELRQQAEDLTTQLKQRRNLLDRTRVLAGNVDTGRGEGDGFMRKYFLPRRTANSIIITELFEAAKTAKLKPKESAFSTEPVDGSDTLTQMRISANFEGSYADVVRFINLLDKSSRLVIIESLSATPQQGGTVLNVTLKLDTFVTEDGSTA